MYRYNYDLASSLAAIGAGLWCILMVVALVASIVLTVIGYFKYARIPGSKLIDVKDKDAIGPFLRFDTFLIERVLKILYMFFALFHAFSCVATLISSFVVNFLMGFVMVFVMAIVLVVGEILIRITYESRMLRIVIARNTTEIKQQLGGGSPSNASAMFDGAPTGGQGAGLAPSVSPAHRGAPSAPQAQPSGWGSLQAGGSPSASFTICPNCGARLQAGSRFCGACGSHI